jgi:hypothetical protein
MKSTVAHSIPTEVAISSAETRVQWRETTPQRFTEEVSEMFAVNYTDSAFWQQIVAYAKAQKRWQDLIIQDAYLIVLGDVAHYFLAQRTQRAAACAA